MNSMEMNEIHKRVQDALETIRPYLHADGGDIELVEVTADNLVKVRLRGACSSCHLSYQTMKTGVEMVVRKAVPEITEVVAV